MTTRSSSCPRSRCQASLPAAIVPPVLELLGAAAAVLAAAASRPPPCFPSLPADRASFDAVTLLHVAQPGAVSPDWLDPKVERTYGGEQDGRNPSCTGGSCSTGGSNERATQLRCGSPWCRW